MTRPLLTAELASRLDRLDLIARLVVEGFLTGLHKSPYHGFSVEFAEYRQYLPGDPINHLDWRVYAKTDRHYLKVFAEETNLRATLLLDCSASMAFRPETGRPSKLDYARLLAAALGYLLLHQKDAVGLVTFDERPLAVAPARSVRRQLFQLLKILQEAPTGAGTRLGPVLHAVAERVHRRGLIILLSDLLDEPAAVMGGLKHFRHRGHEVIVYHVLDPREIDLELRREHEFEDLERPGHRLRAEPALLRAGYRRRLEAWRDELRRECRRARVDLVEVTTDTPLETALHAVLGKRRRLA